MLERIGAASIILGFVLGAVALLVLALHWVFARFRWVPWKRRKVFVGLLIVSVLMTTMPIVVNSVVTRFIHFGPLDTIVNGERHLTLTGWDGHDYAVIASHSDVVVLQMANTDVTDDTLRHLSGWDRLRELDLNDSQITDAGLDVIAKLPNLRDLRVARTKITDVGFRHSLFEKASLMNLDLTGTSVASKTIREWKTLNPDRKALK